MIDLDLPQWLAALGTNAGERVYTGNPPQNPTFPYIVIWRLAGGEEERDLTTGKAMRQSAMFRIEAAARNYDDAFALAKQVATGLDGFKGAMFDTAVWYVRRQNFGPDLSEVDGDQTIRRLPSEYAFTFLEG